MKTARRVLERKPKIFRGFLPKMPAKIGVIYTLWKKLTTNPCCGILLSTESEQTFANKRGRWRWYLRQKTKGDPGASGDRGYAEIWVCADRKKDGGMEGRKQFTFYRSYYEALQKLPEHLRLGALEAVIGYALDGIEPMNLSDMQDMAFLLIRPTLDAGRKMAAGGKKGKPGKRSDKGGQKEGEKEEENEKENEKENEREREIEDECPGGGFEAFWDLYPVKLGKEKAKDAWKRLKPDPQAACDGVKKWRQTKQWKEEKGRFIPRAAKFLEERHYEHLPPGHIPLGASGVLGKAELEAIAMLMGDE